MEPKKAVEIASGQVKLSLPQSWSSHEVLSVFPPDCEICSGSEYEEIFRIKNGAGVRITVMIFPGGVVSVPSSKDEVFGIKEKNPGCIIGDTISENRQGYKYTSISYRQVDSTMPYYYHVSTKWSGPYRTVVAHFGGKDTKDFWETVAEIQKSVRINPAFLNTAKL
ncbi:hypothetical protein [Hymenobacter sediminicola]|uniref:Uncharacterized protein n=1 Tax=Hymenobacter sediminicola TaxID=2761579 RepID=A0A7G7WAB5_9BACT|nr:hypothetical protein [Hymenobacter sediminicola]QNH63308.1 hypothetical protein H4317_05750 [Hymenobacter sediminicola]